MIHLRSFFPILAALGFALCLPQMAPAQVLSDVFCDDTKRVEQSLTQRVGAQRQAQGVRSPDALIELWIVPSSGDWTMVQTYANGTSCIVAMGEYWQPLSEEPA
jgi:hypothetical protein